MTRIAIVHERWTELGGSENVVRALADEFLDAKICVPYADPRTVPNDLADRIAVTGLDRVHRLLGRRSHVPLMPLAPWAHRHATFAGAQAIVISHHATAVAAAPAARQRGIPVIAYVHSPGRWAWDRKIRATETSSRIGAAALAALAAQNRAVERRAVSDLSVVVANSRAVAKRISDWWGIPARVIPPGVDTRRFDLPVRSTARDRPDPYFLVAGRLVPYRRVDIAIRAAQAAGKRLVVAGSGRGEAALRAIAGPETTFLGRVSDAEMVSLQQGAIATLMPGEEDFGIVPVEAMASGTPVIARAAGGALDTVIDGSTGILVADGQDGDVIAEFAHALNDVESMGFDAHVLREHALNYSIGRFQSEMRALVCEVAD